MDSTNFTFYLLDLLVITVVFALEILAQYGHPSPDSTSGAILRDDRSLAFHIYYALLSQSEASSAIDALPSYQAIGEAAVSFLDELMDHGVDISNVFFDGSLPPKKRGTRLGRLQSYLKQLISYHASHANGMSINHDQKASLIKKSLLFGGIALPPSIRGLPAVPFLVPTVLEALHRSRHGSVIELVPDEADSYCAWTANRNGGLVLTSDSDLLVHDLGPDGAVGFFNSIRFQECSECGGQSIVGRICQRKALTSRLGTEDLVRVGYEIQRDPTTSLMEAVRRSKLQIIHDPSGEFSKFCREYSHSDKKLAAFPVAHSWWDPRVSEFFVQVWTQSPGEIHIYLPFLIEDPTRVSAWIVSSEIRSFAYSVLMNSPGSDEKQMLLEFRRSGQSIHSTEAATLTPTECGKYAEGLASRVKAIRSSFGDQSYAMRWRSFCMIDLYRWYIENGRTLPTNEEANHVLGCSYSSSWQKWSEIHLLAQLEGLLYSFRMAKQILDQVDIQSPSLLDLRQALCDLPDINVLMPPRRRSYAKSTYAQASLEAARKIPDVSNTPDPEEVRDPAGDIGSEAWHISRPTKKKKRKQGVSNSSETSREKATSNNIYSLLAES